MRESGRFLGNLRRGYLPSMRSPILLFSYEVCHGPENKTYVIQINNSWGWVLHPPPRLRTHNVRNDPLTRKGAPREHQEKMGNGPVVWAQQGAGCPHPPLASQGTWCERMDDRKVLSGIIHVIQKGLCWVDALAANGPHKTLYNCCRHW